MRSCIGELEDSEESAVLQWSAAYEKVTRVKRQPVCQQAARLTNAIRVVSADNSQLVRVTNPNCAVGQMVGIVGDQAGNYQRKDICRGRAGRIGYSQLHVVDAERSGRPPQLQI